MSQPQATSPIASESLVEAPRRRGRPPKGSRPMTNAERQKAFKSRQALKEATLEEPPVAEISEDPAAVVESYYQKNQKKLAADRQRLKDLETEKERAKAEELERLQRIEEEAKKKEESKNFIRDGRDFVLTVMAAAGSSFTSISSWWLSHHEVQQAEWKWILVIAALAFSGPNLVGWVSLWCSEEPRLKLIKSIGLAVLMEITTVFSTTWWLADFALTFLVFTNMFVGIEHYIDVVSKNREEMEAKERRKITRHRSREI